MEVDEKIIENKAPGRNIFLSRLKRKILKHVFFVRLLVVTLFAVFIFGLGSFLNNALGDTKLGGFLSFSKNFVFSGREDIKAINDRINFVILGSGGEGHEAPDLTDTIIFGSISINEKDLSLVSIPRDVWIPGIRAKLNSAYYWGEQKQENGGFVLAKASVEEVVGVPIHYGILIDFSGFKDIIDVIEGIEVDVERSFTDEKYPIPGKENDLCDGDLELKCRYETIIFEDGAQMMNGETALKFVRSRNASGDEGTDFARTRRQQDVISAIKDKILSPKVFLSPRKISGLTKIFGEKVKTDLDKKEVAFLLKRLVIVNGNIRSSVIPEDFLINPPPLQKYDNLYVFVPSDGTWYGVHNWIENLLFDEKR